jgi:hypothetical protein
MVSIFIGFLATVRTLHAGETRRRTGHLSPEVRELQPAAYAMN